MAKRKNTGRNKGRGNNNPNSTRIMRKGPTPRERQAAAAQQKEQQTRIITVGAGILLFAVIGFVVWQLLPNRGETAGSAPAADLETLFANCDELPVEGERPLAELDPIERNGFYDSCPQNMLEAGVDYQARIVTSKGEMLLDLYEDDAPLTVNNFVFLAEQGFYDDTIFHRVLEDFMAQAGDPTGTGTGGPGYQFADETNNGRSFTGRGQLAMANAGPGTNGSQFFITFISTDWLTGNHTIFGELIEGDDVLGSIDLRDPGAGGDADVIERIEIVEN